MLLLWVVVVVVRRVLNKEVWLYDVLPHGSAIYDLWSTDAVLPRNQNNMYDLAVLHPDEGSRLYFESVPGVGNSAHPDMYDSSLFNISLDACAQACYDTYSSWSVSHSLEHSHAASRLDDCP